jgi:hypothetical protein
MLRVLGTEFKSWFKEQRQSSLKDICGTLRAKSMAVKHADIKKGEKVRLKGGW